MNDDTKKAGEALGPEHEAQMEALKRKLAELQAEASPEGVAIREVTKAVIDIRSKGYFTGAMTLEDIRAAKPERIYYGANTCWWTHDPADLSRHPEAGLPCDPRGGMLMMTDDVEGFLSAAEANPEHYGKHGLRAFLAAHHRNMTRSRADVRPWCFRTWAEYDAVLDGENPNAPLTPRRFA